MALTSMESVAFSRPGGETCGKGRARPIDLAHLSRQTMGDRDLEREVLSMFLHQARMVGDRLAGANAQERQSLAHGLKGAARGIGAFAVAEAAGQVEADPLAEAGIGELREALACVRDFVAAISR